MPGPNLNSYLLKPLLDSKIMSDLVYFSYPELIEQQLVVAICRSSRHGSKSVQAAYLQRLAFLLHHRLEDRPP